VPRADNLATFTYKVSEKNPGSPQPPGNLEVYLGYKKAINVTDLFLISRRT
jgi:hypothetical protein